MAGGWRWLTALCCILTLLLLGIARAQEPAPPSTTDDPPASVTGDAVRLLELGKLLMGQNNPEYAVKPVALSIEARNNAGAQAQRTFDTLVKLYPQFADGWLWLGISRTETLRFSKEHPEGQPVQTEGDITEGINAFRTAYERNPAALVYVTFYGDALMEYRKDFDAARKLWEGYLKSATTDLQRVTAYVQMARACFNKAYFGKSAKMAPEEIRQQYQMAESYVQQAAKLCPNAADVKMMQALMQQHRKAILGK